MTRAAIYARVSTTRQAERDLSLPDQIAQCRAHCERQGWQVVEVFCEPGASALDDDRAVFQEMIYKATRPERPFSYVVVHSLSRFSRDSLHSELYVRKLRKAGVELVSITQTVSSDSSGEMFRKLLNVFDEHQSRENAKHVHRAMCENARQGFWNGSRPPFGYRTQVAERRGAKDKKVLVVDDEEARAVREIFDLASGREGRPLGVKAIACRLTDRAVTRRGVRFSTGSVYEVLTSSTYCGQSYFNRRDSRTGAPRPPSQWVGVQVPAIIDESTFNAVQALLQSRSPKRQPPRVVNGPTFLAGLVRCGYCGAAMIQNTGKGGRYRYYCCSRKLKEGPSGCRGLRTPMEKLARIGARLVRAARQGRRAEALRRHRPRARHGASGGARARARRPSRRHRRAAAHHWTDAFDPSRRRPCVDPSAAFAFDGRTSGEILKLIGEACIFRPQLAARFVLNRCGARTIIARETAELLVDHDPPVLGSTIGQRIGFADAARSGRLVDEIDDDGPAAGETASLTAEIERLMP